MPNQTVFQVDRPGHQVDRQVDCLGQLGHLYPNHPKHLGGLVWTCLLILTCLVGCINGSHYGAGTLVGLRVGAQEGVGFTLGYQKYELGVCGPSGQATVDLTEKMSSDGVERGQVLTLGCPDRAQTVAPVASGTQAVALVGQTVDTGEEK